MFLHRINDDAQATQIQDLMCTTYDNQNSKKVFYCTYSTYNGTCIGNQAAISCSWTLGQIVGLGVGLLALCLLITCLPICLVICCCCGVCAGARRSRTYANL